MKKNLFIALALMLPMSKAFGVGIAQRVKNIFVDKPTTQLTLEFGNVYIKVQAPQKNLEQMGATSTVRVKFDASLKEQGAVINQGDLLCLSQGKFFMIPFIRELAMQQVPDTYYQLKINGIAKETYDNRSSSLRSPVVARIGLGLVCATLSYFAVKALLG